MRSKPRIIDPLMRQVVHQFEQILPPNPANQDIDDQVVGGERSSYNIHRLDIRAPKGFCPCVTKTESEFMMRRFEMIERTRERETQKNWARAIEINNDRDYQHNLGLPEPEPNLQHTYCQVCNESYEDYMDHVRNSLTHKKRSKV